MTTPSGPGAFSQRTDKAVSNANSVLPNANYGENKDYQEMKSGAPMAQGGSQAAPMNLQDMFGGMGQETIPLNAESAMPGVPVTDGAASGAGAGTEAIGGTEWTANVDELKAAMFAMEWMANRPNSSDSARNLVRVTKAKLGM